MEGRGSSALLVTVGYRTFPTGTASYRRLTVGWRCMAEESSAGLGPLDYRTTGLRPELGKYLGGFMRFYPGLGGVSTLPALLKLTWGWGGAAALVASTGDNRCQPVSTGDCGTPTSNSQRPTSKIEEGGGRGAGGF